MTHPVLQLPRIRSRKLGDFTLHTIVAGGVMLDGGAMFGVVPKPLWQKQIPADEYNRIPLAMRCLLVETPDALVLIDNGAGNKEDSKFKEIYRLENDGSPTLLEDGLVSLGFNPNDVTTMIDTHLHFDHAGGNTYVEEEGGPPRLSFPRARYFVQKGEWEYAHSRNERIRASYLPNNFDPVQEAGALTLLEGDVQVVPGISVLRTPGHTPHHQSVLISSGGETAIFLADVMPTVAHLPLPWIMGYDVEPLVTLESKRTLVARARAEDWLLVFEHEPVTPWGRLDPKESKPVLVHG